MTPRKYTPTSLVSTSGLLCLLLTCSLSPVALYAQQTNWTAPKEAVDKQNPVVPSGTVLSEAKAIYTANCGPCHGEKGKGDGPAAQALNPKPADHTSTVVQSESDGSLFWKVSEGRNPMPSYKKVLSELQRWELICYIRSLGRPAKKK
jgi:mono/diheme cytochrome c family protein